MKPHIVMEGDLYRLYLNGKVYASAKTPRKLISHSGGYVTAPIFGNRLDTIIEPPKRIESPPNNWQALVIFIAFSTGAILGYLLSLSA